MANVFTNLEQNSLLALDMVARERVGMLNAVRSDFSADPWSLNHTVRSFVSPASSAADTTAGSVPPDSGDQTFTNRTLSITKDRHIAIRWTAEDMKQMSGSTGPGADRMMQDQLAQAYRTLCNEVETDLAALHIYASRAKTAAGSAFFDSTGGIKDIASVKQMLVDNGAPEGDISLVVGSADNINLLGVPNLYKANEAADSSFLRQGILGNVFGVNLRHSPKINSFVKGTLAGSPVVSNAGYAVGDTVLTISGATGSTTIKAGDIISITGDASAEKYVVATGTTDASTGTITLAAPGLRGALSAATHAITIYNYATSRNMMFDRNAICLATRVPATIPGEADGKVIVQDPRSGLAFQILTYYQYHRVYMEVGLAWGCAVMKPEFLALAAI